MLTAQGCLSRRQRLWNNVADDVEWLLIADPRHVHYLANFWIQEISFSGHERGLLLLERDGKATLLADNFAIRSAASPPHVDEQIVATWYDHKHSIINRDHALLELLQQVTDRLKNRQGLVEAEWLPLGAVEFLPLGSFTYSLGSSLLKEGDSAQDLGMILREMRRAKDPDEIDLLRLCMNAVDAGQARLFEVAQPGVTELEIFREVQSASLAAAQRTGIVYGDFRANWPDEPKLGGLPQGEGRTLKEGDVFILDYSVQIDGYRSDFTNSVAIGEPSPELVELFEMCLAGMQAGEAKLGDGVAAKDVYDAVVAPYYAAEKKEFYTNHVGHGLGLAHPESPIIVPQTTDTIRTGDVITLEPAVYVKGIGGLRIEHNYLITDSGYERLSNHEIRLK